MSIFSPAKDSVLGNDLAVIGPAPTRLRLVTLASGATGGAEIDSETLQAAIVLLAALHVGHNVAKLARVTGVTMPVVAKCARRLIDNGVWHNGSTVRTWQVDPAAGIDHVNAFWADVDVALGKLCRRLMDDGSPEWAPAGHWWKDYNLLRQEPNEAVAATYHSRVSPSEEEGWDVALDCVEGEARPSEAPESVEGAVSPLPALFPDASLDAHGWLPGSVVAQTVEDSMDASGSPLETAAATAEFFPDATWLG